MATTRRSVMAVADRSLGCGTQGCGPAVVKTLPLWRGRRRMFVCWVCERPLDPAQVREANTRWGQVRDALAARWSGERS